MQRFDLTRSLSTISRRVRPGVVVEEREQQGPLERRQEPEQRDPRERLGPLGPRVLAVQVLRVPVVSFSRRNSRQAVRLLFLRT